MILMLKLGSSDTENTGAQSVVFTVSVTGLGAVSCDV